MNGPPTETSSDTERFAFTDEGPWQVERSQLTWARGIETLRVITASQVPALVTRRTLPPVSRSFVVAVQLGSALARWAALERRHGGTRSRAALSARLRRAAERLGPTYIKLGQIISSGEGLFPRELVEEFKACRDQVPPESFEVVREIVEADLGSPLEQIFAEFERVPLASASIAQVHRARLRTGEEVVVKVQRPTIRAQVKADLSVMAWLAPLLVGRIPVTALANPPALVELFAATISEELDFRIEAANMLDMAASFAELGQHGVIVPRPHPTLVTRRVLVMERLHGIAFDDLESMHEAGIDTHEIIRVGMRAFTEGCLVHGLFHGDLHGGNLFILNDGRIALLDFGITARMSEQQRLAFLRLMLSGASSDVTGQLAALRDLGALPPDTDLDEVIRELGLDRDPIDPTQLTQQELVAELQRMIKALLGMGARLPKVLMLYVKNLVFLDGAIAKLAPDLDLLSEVAGLSVYLSTTHGDRLAAEVGASAGDFVVDREDLRRNAGLDIPEGTPLTYRDLRKRRELIRRRLG